MLKRNNVWLGTLLGLILPGLAFLFVDLIKRNVRFLQKDDLLYIGCVALNLLLVRYFFKTDKDETAKGVVVSTFICAFIFMYYKSRQ